MGYFGHYASCSIKEYHDVVVADYVNSGFEVLRHTLRGNVGVFALVSPSKRKFVAISLYSMHNGVPGGKTLSEDSCPYYIDVPQVYIDITKDDNDPRSEYAIKWRQRVTDHNAKSKKANAIYRKLPIGYKLTINGGEYEAVGLNPITGFANGKHVKRVSDGAIFTASKKTFIESIMTSME